LLPEHLLGDRRDRFLQIGEAQYPSAKQMKQDDKLPSSFQEPKCCFDVGCGGSGSVALRHDLLLDILFSAYFLFNQHGATLLNVQTHTKVISMTLDRMPQPIVAYLAPEEAKNAQALSHCFAEDGTVHDEGKDYHGRAAIQRWKEAADAKYRYVLQPISAQTQCERTTVLARLTGDFPGSPVDLNHIFTISHDEIVSLEIRS